MPEPLPVAIYCRVSSARQDATRQVQELTAHAQQQGYHVVATFVETVSATKRQAKQRVELQKLLKLAAQGDIRKVLVSEMSRLGRKLTETIHVIDQLMEWKVSVWAKNLNLETLLPTLKRNSAAMMVLMVYAEIAQSEGEQLSERIKSGQAATEKTIGRPAGSIKNAEALVKHYPAVRRELVAKQSIRKTAKICEVSDNTVQKVKKALIALGKL